MRNLLIIIADAKKNAISGSKLIANIKADTSAKNDFESYLDALETVYLYEGTKNVWCQNIKNRFNSLEPSKFIKFLALNCKETQKIDGRSLLSAIKIVAKVKELKHITE